jgi:hypothetical protein
MVNQKLCKFYSTAVNFVAGNFGHMPQNSCSPKDKDTRKVYIFTQLSTGRILKTSPRLNGSSTHAKQTGHDPIEWGIQLLRKIAIHEKRYHPIMSYLLLVASLF